MSNHTKLLYLKRNLNSQRGQTLLAMLVILVFGLSAAIYALVRPTSSAVERDKITADALAQAKAALIGYAVGVDLAGSGRLGDLPCPDTDDSGQSGTSCGNAAGTTGQTTRIGRLPWRSLGLPDLRDGDGERLWYAVSKNFKYNFRSACASPGDPGCLNSDARGTITVRNNAGILIHDGSNPDPFTPSGVIAVIFAPGGVIQRQGTGTPQIRDCSGAGCGFADACNSTATPKCDPANYLDVVGPPVLTIAGATASTENNAVFIDGSSSDGFISGVIKDSTGNVVVNDRLITITYADLMPLLERRVAKEAYNCMIGYGAASYGRYPWAASVSASASGDYSSVQNERFGRIPDSFSQTLLGINLPILAPVVNAVCSVLPALCMRNSWPPSTASPPCYIATGSWWLNWKEHVFYGVADAYKPAATVQILPPAVTVLPPPIACDAIAGNYDCLAVSPPTATTADNKRFVVIVAGKRLSIPSDPPFVTTPLNQVRSTLLDKQNSANYLERENGNNSGISNMYGQESPIATFNDTLLFLQ